MTSSRKLIFLSFGMLLVSAALVHMSVVTIGPIQPNLILASLIVSSLFTHNALFLAVLIGVATMFIRQGPVFFDPLALASAFAVLSAFFIKQRVVWPDRIGVFILMFYGTTLIYAIVSPSFIVTHAGLFVLELFINAVVGLIFFEVFSRVVGRGHQ